MTIPITFNARKIRIGNGQAFYIPKGISQLLQNETYYKITIEKKEVDKNDECIIQGKQN
jgi:translation elongation factor P/translation initiation factor 5A